MKVRVIVSHLLELPDDAEIVAGGRLIKLTDGYLAPVLDYWQSSDFDSRTVHFHELGKEIRARITAAVAHSDVSVAIA